MEDKRITSIVTRSRGSSFCLPPTFPFSLLIKKKSSQREAIFIHLFTDNAAESFFLFFGKKALIGHLEEITISLVSFAE